MSIWTTNCHFILIYELKNIIDCYILINLSVKSDFCCRDSYKKVDLEKSYPALFEMLWYSQLPCFDVMNVTTLTNEEHGRSRMGT